MIENKTNSKTPLYNKSDWVIIITYFSIALIVGMADISKLGWKVHLLEQLAFIFYCILPITILLKFVFPLTLYKGKYLLFFLYSVVVLTFIGYFEVLTFKLINGYNWNVSGIKFFYYAILSQTENIGLLLSILVIKRLFEAKLNISNLEKEKKSSELRMLNSQIDPHFLFNNLNTVDNLIDNDPEEAKKYLNQLSKLYRYLISTKDEELVVLKDEIDFSQNYIYLIKKRFGDAFVFSLDFESNTIERNYVPPGAVQGLLENAVKHNRGTPDNPVIIKVEISGDEIIVSNNIISRVNPIDSTGSGLDNINNRYLIIYNKPIQISKGKDFVVKLPNIRVSDN